MTAARPTPPPPAKIALYDRLIATDPTLERKGATLPYTSINGKMFTYLSKTGELALRLPEVEREAFMKKHKTTLAVSYGTEMKDWVAVPDSLLARPAALRSYLRISREYAATLGKKRTPTGASGRAGAGRPRTVGRRQR